MLWDNDIFHLMTQDERDVDLAAAMSTECEQQRKWCHTSYDQCSGIEKEETLQ